MAARTYQNFDLLLEAAGAASFRARVTSSPLGESPSATFALPFDATQLENLLLKLDPGRSGTRRTGADPQAQASMDLGGPLFEAVFADDILLAWTRSQDAARAAGDGLRLRLRLTDAPAIAGLPWELLYDRRVNSFIAQSERTPLVRYLEVPQPPRPLAVHGALRILCLISSPTDLPELDVEGEWRRIQDALATKVAQGTVKVDRLPAPTIQALGTWLRHNDVHILHVIAHGEFDERIQDGVVYFTDRYGRSVAVSPTILGPYLRDHDPLRLVVLNACQTARVDATDPFSGMAQGLVQQDCTAVVAMQFPISDGAATTFTGEFYGALADGLPVDQAATSARKAMLADHAAEWATPVLFLRAPDGQVFDHILAQPEVTTVPTPVPSEDDQETANGAPTAVAAPDFTPDPPPRPTGPPQPAFPPQRAYPARPAYPPQPAHPPQPTSYAREQAPRRSRRGAVVAGALVALVAVVGALAWYGSTLPPGGGTVGGGGGQQAQRSTLSGPTISAARLSTGLTIDGRPDDWPSTAPTVDSNAVVAGDRADINGTWALAWDDERLYLIVDVTDPALVQTHAADPSQLFKGDGVSFELGTAVPQNGNAALEPGDKHVLLGVPVSDANAAPSLGRRAVLSAINVAAGRVFGRGTNTIQGLDAASVTTDHGYVIEASIPWATLGVASPQPGTELGMNLNVSDAVQDGAARGELSVMVSNNPERAGNDASFRSRWGTLVLQG